MRNSIGAGVRLAPILLSIRVLAKVPIFPLRRKGAVQLGRGEAIKKALLKEVY
jgi:hypothetical protein